jgi:hypothetical protein
MMHTLATVLATCVALWLVYEITRSMRRIFVRSIEDMIREEVRAELEGLYWKNEFDQAASHVEPSAPTAAPGTANTPEAEVNSTPAGVVCVVEPAPSTVAVASDGEAPRSVIAQAEHVASVTRAANGERAVSP